ncbi:GAF domain-containing protein [Candidatus Saccharibacteria bacterium TM7i]|nr:GAF domain-containing protein [Candidatus Saccharibacteria bacterium TM7i]
MEIYGLLVVSVLTISLGVASLFQHTRDHTVHYFFATVLGTSLWALGIALFLSTSSIEIATFAASLYYSAAALIAVATALIGLSIGRRKPVSLRTVISLSIPPIAIIATLFLAPKILFTEVVLSDNGANTITLASWPYMIYGIYFLSYFSIGVYGMFAQMRRTRKKQQLYVRLQYITFAYLISGIIGAWFNLILPWTGDYNYIWIGPLGLLLFVPIVYIAIAKYGLFDVRSAVLRAATYTLALAALAGVYYLLAYAVSVVVFRGSVSNEMSISPINVLLALVLAFLFQPFKRFFDKLTNSIFYRSMYSTDELYSQLNTLIRSTPPLRALLQGSSELISKALKAEFVTFFIYREDGRPTMVVGSEGHKKIAPADVHMFDDLREPLYIEDSRMSSPMYRLFVSHRLSIVVPLYHADQVVGVMCLGDHRTSRYSNRDLRVLRVIAGELVVGIQNALAIQEIKSLNDNLKQRIDAATKELRRNNTQLRRLDKTKDEFISMASHQLRTPLTSIKGYISMLIDGDLGKVTTQQREVLEEAFSSSERMVHLIGDFLNVSRLQTGKFVIEKRTTDFATLVESEVNALRQSAESRELELQYAKPKNIPTLELDADKFRQVIMNFIDNALYYSKSGSAIKITLKKTADAVEFRVKDTGIGVPESEQAGLFGKFFRASNARRTRPDGTGVGLFLAKKVVADHHGEIIFESKEGKGSTFGFRLPLPKAD